MKRGRPKGHSPYISISYDELGDWVGRKSKVLVCRKWYNKISNHSEDDLVESSRIKEAPAKEDSIIEYTLTQL